MKYEHHFYATSDKLLDIEFLFADLGAALGWRAYILSDINYQMFSKSRSDSCSIVHRLLETDVNMQQKIHHFLRMTGRVPNENASIRYICWSKCIYCLEDMREAAKTWSELTAYYIRHGGTFETIQPKLESKGILTLW